MAWVALGKEATTGAGWPAKGCLEDLAPDSPLQLSSEREGQAETHPHSPPHPSPRETWRVGWNPPTSGSALCENDAITTLKSYPCGAFARSSSPVSHFQTTWDAALNCNTSRILGPTLDSPGKLVYRVSAMCWSAVRSTLRSHKFNLSVLISLSPIKQNTSN